MMSAEVGGNTLAAFMEETKKAVEARAREIVYAHDRGWYQRFYYCD